MNAMSEVLVWIAAPFRRDSEWWLDDQGQPRDLTIFAGTRGVFIVDSRRLAS